MEEFFAVTCGYLAGSVPFAFVLAHRYGLDLRVIGSGNLGATNVLRTRGVPAAVIALALDAGKGALAVLIAQRLADGPATSIAAGLAAIIGHVYPVWLRFRGGKGVATAAGVFVVLAPMTVMISAVVFVAGVWITRYVSVGSIAAAVTMAGTTAASDAPGVVVAGAVVAALIVVHRHRGNIARLAAGTEQRIGQRIRPA
jgi:glycerol-3-phosphate acyltransferase PlsY